MKTVRIQRKRKSNVAQMFAWANLFTLIAKQAAQPVIEDNLSYMQELKAEESKKRAELLEMRKQKAANDLVIQDQKIEEQQMKLRLLRRELEIRGLEKPEPKDGNPF